MVQTDADALLVEVVVTVTVCVRVVVTAVVVKTVYFVLVKVGVAVFCQRNTLRGKTLH